MDASDSIVTAHWSIDFVEHLRNVHFALISVFTGILILLLTSNHDQRAQRAITQATEIEDFRVHWADARKLIYHAVIGYLPPQGWFTLRVDLGKDKRRPKSIGPVIYFAMVFDIDNFTKARYRDPRMDVAPTNLGEFKSWWDEVQKGEVAYAPDLSSPHSWTCEAVLKGLPNGTNLPGRCYTDLGPFSAEYMDVVEANQKSMSSNMLSGKSSLELDKDRSYYPGSSIEASREWAELDAEHHYSSVSGQSPAEQTLAIRVTGVPIVAKPFDQKVIRQFLPGAGNGDFDHAFAELSESAKEFGSLTFQELVGRLLEKSRKADNSLDIVGLKLPTDILSFFGIPFLLAIQCYFLVHLTEFAEKIDVASPGLEVAWIGLYRSLGARVLMLISTLLLPIFVFGAFVSSAWHDMSLDLSHITIALVSLGAGFGMVLAVFTQRRLHRLRVNLTTPESAVTEVRDLSG